MSDRWLKAAGKKMEAKGTKGTFTAHAKREGHSVQKQASIDAHKPGKLGERARFAKAMGSIARKHKR